MWTKFGGSFDRTWDNLPNYKNKSCDKSGARTHSVRSSFLPTKTVISPALVGLEGPPLPGPVAEGLSLADVDVGKLGDAVAVMLMTGT